MVTISDLQKEVHEGNQIIERLDTSVHNLRRIIERQANELSIANARVKLLKDENDSNDDLLDELADERKKVLDKNEALNGCFESIRQYEKRTADLDKTIKRLENERNEEIVKNQQQREEIAQLKASLESLVQFMEKR